MIETQFMNLLIIFVDSAHKIMDNYDHDLVLNTDHFGLQLEMFCNRMLSYQDGKLILGIIRSISNSTHSHMVQPMISMSGRLVSLLPFV